MSPIAEATDRVLRQLNAELKPLRAERTRLVRQVPTDTRNATLEQLQSRIDAAFRRAQEAMVTLRLQGQPPGGGPKATA